MNLSTWLSRVTLDVIGQAGFGYEFGAVEGKTTILAEAFQKMFAAGGTKKPPTPFWITVGRGLGRLLAVVPFDLAGWLPVDRLKRLKAGLLALEEESRKIVMERKKVVEAEGEESLTSSKDLMSLLRESAGSRRSTSAMMADAYSPLSVRSNMSGDPKTMLTDTELQGQMTVRSPSPPSPSLLANSLPEPHRRCSSPDTKRAAPPSPGFFGVSRRILKCKTAFAQRCELLVERRSRPGGMRSRATSWRGWSTSTLLWSVFSLLSAFIRRADANSPTARDPPPRKSRAGYDPLAPQGRAHPTRHSPPLTERNDSHLRRRPRWFGPLPLHRRGQQE